MLNRTTFIFRALFVMTAASLTLCVSAGAAQKPAASVVSPSRASMPAPKPFGLEIGVASEEDTRAILTREGGTVVDDKMQYYINESVPSAAAHGVAFEGVRVPGVNRIVAWFTKGHLYQMYFTVNPSSLNAISEQLTAKYGKPDSRKETGNSILIVWRFSNDKTVHLCRNYGGDLYLEYHDNKLEKYVEESDNRQREANESAAAKGIDRIM